MNRTKFDEAMDQVYGWEIDEKTNKITPPAVAHPFPKCVCDRLKWINQERDNGLTFRGAIHFLLDVEDDQALKKEWDEGWSASDYLPVTKDYYNWITAEDTPFADNLRQNAVVIALTYSWKCEENDEIN